MKRGFTLIELLAVIIILAIIAVITIPVVITLIDDSANSTETMSGQSYANAVIKTLMKQSLDEKDYYEPSECIINKDGNVTCDGKDLKIVADGEKPIDGFLKFYEGELIEALIKFEDATIVTNAAGELVNLNGGMTCVRATEETKTTGKIPEGKFLPGDEYICEVKEDTKYHFFVISSDEDRINLILDRNINNDGTLATTGINESSPRNGKYNLIEWISGKDYTSNNTDGTSCSSTSCVDEGPITALDFLYNATKNWKNISNMDEMYEDENMTSGNPKYESITLTGKARLPKYSELANVGCKSTAGTCPDWLTNYLSVSPNIVSNMYGYWTLSTYYSYPSMACRVSHNSSLNNANTYQAIGIRPVISVTKKDIY